jgi:hypothetical protein
MKGKPIRLASVPDEIQTNCSPNTTTRLRHYCHSSPLSITGIDINFPQGALTSVYCFMKYYVRINSK